MAPNLHYDSASACPLSLSSKEIKCTKARNTRQRAPTRRPDTTCNQSHSHRYARGHQAPLNLLSITTLVLDGVTVRDIIKTAVDLAIDRGAARTS